MFNLHKLAREVIAGTNSPDRDVITDALFDSIPLDERDACLRLTLRGYVGTVLGTERRENMSTPEAVMGSVQVSPKPQQGRSWRRDAISGQRAHLRVNVTTAYGPKYLADCTRDDLLFAAARRRGSAAGLHAEARKFEAWAAAVNEHGAATVGDLSAEVVAQVLLGVAA